MDSPASAHPLPDTALDDRIGVVVTPAAAPAGAPAQDLGPERRVLKVLAQRHPARFTEAQWATLAGMKRTGGTWSTYKGRLRKGGLIEQDAAGLWTVTPEGLDAAGEVPPAPRTPEDVRAMWMEKLGAERRMLQAVIDHGPIGRDGLAGYLDMTASGGTFGTYLSRLRANDLIKENNGLIEAAEELTDD